MHCPIGTNNWPKYLAVSLLPTTLFFLGAVALKFTATSPLMMGSILHCQILTSPTVHRHIGLAFFNEHYYASLRIVLGLYISYLGIWNLDLLFRMAILLASQCLNLASTLSGLHHSSLSSCLNCSHIHTCFSQLQSYSVAVGALLKMLC